MSNKEKQERVRKAHEKNKKKEHIRDRIKLQARKLALGNPLARQVIAHRSHGAVVEELSKGTTADQIGRLDELVGIGSVSNRKMKEAIMRKAPKEMDKAIRKFQSEGKEVSVDTLCAEVRADTQFRKLCQKIDLDISWFGELARERMEANRA